MVTYGLEFTYVTRFLLQYLAPKGCQPEPDDGPTHALQVIPENPAFTKVMAGSPEEIARLVGALGGVLPWAYGGTQQIL